MTKYKEDREFRGRYLIGLLFGFIPAMFAAVIGVNNFNDNFSVIKFIACIAIFITGLIIVLKWMVFSYKNYRCPQCKQHIPKKNIDEYEKKPVSIVLNVILIGIQ